MINLEAIKGVSVIICCYNSAGRIRETLLALARQEFYSPLRWEIIVVNNASTDNTAEMALDLWQQFDAVTEMRVVMEPRMGQGNARYRGIREAIYSTLLFCDDDNWLTPNYVQGIFDILESDPGIAACGGKAIPVFETTQPSWFTEYHESFATGSQEITSENGRLLNLYGAGMGMQRHAWDHLHMTGFEPLMQGRTGKKLSSSDDTELTYAFVLMGYTLHYAAELNFFHYMPKERLSLTYLKKLYTANGADGPVRNLYYAHISDRVIHKRLVNWNIHILLSLVRLVKYSIFPPKKKGRVIYFRWSIAYIRELLHIRSRYPLLLKRITAIKSPGKLNSARAIQLKDLIF
jgi:glycosyltransferase involved in cell wall biosynthesis